MLLATGYYFYYHHHYHYYTYVLKWVLVDVLHVCG